MSLDMLANLRHIVSSGTPDMSNLEGKVGSNKRGFVKYAKAKLAG